jgi:hypothetical protein
MFTGKATFQKLKPSGYWSCSFCTMKGTVLNGSSVKFPFSDSTQSHPRDAASFEGSKGKALIQSLSYSNMIIDCDLDCMHAIHNVMMHYLNCWFHTNYKSYNYSLLQHIGNYCSMINSYFSA